MNAQNRQTILLATLLLGVGGAAWLMQVQSGLEVDPTPLAEIPMEHQRWGAQDLPMDQPIVEMLQADFNVQRGYIHPLGHIVWLYVGYYGTQRGGRPEHTPWACYPSAGWTIVERSGLFTSNDGSPLRDQQRQ